ncbi:putative lipase atg15, partial [Ceratobasidium sp. 423]
MYPPWMLLILLCSPGLALEFSLRHIHHAHPDTGRILWADADYTDLVASEDRGTYSVETRALTVQRPVSFNELKEWRVGRLGVPGPLRASYAQAPDWKSHEVIGPATDKRETLLALAKMTSNAYFKDHATVGWYDLGGNWTR